MFCKYCGAKIDDNSTFCSVCGKDLTQGKETTSPKADEQKTEQKTNAQTKWFYQEATEVKGPFSYDIFSYKVRNHEIGRYSKVRQEGNNEWISIMSSPFADLLNTRSSEAISFNDIWVWCLAVIPLLVGLAIKYFSILPSSSVFNWIIVLGLNILFIILDRKELQSYADEWLYIGCVLVPIYLVVREIKTNHNFVPAIVWTFLFAVDMFIVSDQ